MSDSGGWPPRDDNGEGPADHARVAGTGRDAARNGGLAAEAKLGEGRRGEGRDVGRDVALDPWAGGPDVAGAPEATRRIPLITAPDHRPQTALPVEAQPPPRPAREPAARVTGQPERPPTSPGAQRTTADPGAHVRSPEAEAARAPGLGQLPDGHARVASFAGSAPAPPAPAPAGAPPPGASATVAGPPPGARTAAPADRGHPPRRSRPETTRDTPVTRRSPRRAHLTLRRVSPWSVFKVTLVLALVLLVVLVIAVALLYTALQALGVFDSVDSFMHELFGSSSTPSTYFSFKQVVGWTAVIGAVNVVMLTILAALGAFLYNVCAEIVGGLELTLSERE